MDELKVLATSGVVTQRWVPLAEGSGYQPRPFRLKGHLISISGDMPAIAKVSWVPSSKRQRSSNHKPQIMHFRGHNAKVPCRCCKMNAINTTAKPQYYLARRSPDDPQAPDYANLPLREHGQVLKQAHSIAAARTDTEADELGMACGIQGQASANKRSSV